MNRQATAVWRGGLKDGQGQLSTESGVLREIQYSFATRFENSIGTNPEELIAAAHAGCFSMALAGQLAAGHLTPENIETTATVTLEKLEPGWAITNIHLVVSANVPGADPAVFAAAANRAKDNCPVSRVLNARITMDARLENTSRAAA